MAKVNLIEENVEKGTKVWHMEGKASFPVAARDFVIVRFGVNEPNRRILVGYSVPSNHVPLSKGAIRMEIYCK